MIARIASAALVVLVLIGACVLSGALGLVVANGATAGSFSREPENVMRFAGHGQFRQSDEVVPRPWHVHALKHQDGTLSAKVNVPGVVEVSQLTVEGHIDGRDAFGVLLTANGEQYTTFEATLDEAGTGGTFVLGNGESGTWGYDAASGKEVRRLMGVTDEPVGEADTTPVIGD